MGWVALNCYFLIHKTGSKTSLEREVRCELLDVECCAQPLARGKWEIHSHLCSLTGLMGGSGRNTAVMALTHRRVPCTTSQGVEESHLATSVRVGHFTHRKQMGNRGSRRNGNLHPPGLVQAAVPLHSRRAAPPLVCGLPSARPSKQQELPLGR